MARRRCDDEKTLLEEKELQWETPREVRMRFRGVDAGVAVAEETEKLRQFDDDLHVGQLRDPAADVLDNGIESFFGYVPEGSVGPALDFAGQEPEVGAPAVIPREVTRVDQADELAKSIVLAEEGQVIIRLGLRQIAVAHLERSCQPLQGRVTCLQARVAARDPVGRLGRKPISQGKSVLVGRYRATEVVAVVPSLSQLGPEVPLDRIRRDDERPQRSGLRPRAVSRLCLGSGEMPQERSGRLRSIHRAFP